MFIRLSIQRPIAVAMAYLAVSILGIVAWRNLPIEFLPDTSYPRLSVTASWPGASPEATEAFLTAPVEAAIQQVAGVQRITSRSGEGSAYIDVEFQRETDMNFARLEMSERLGALEGSLPASGLQ
jgi:multidrug efflux pump subunit AcrB